ncbi:hypothetical protein [Rhodococcoides navarretei]|uniref:GntR C-terminal domain-containing protein n=1 Tax=Rhodococcus navarretei TaxID=3128981 RepID=A0ABU9CZ24_9NOCA
MMDLRAVVEPPIAERAGVRRRTSELHALRTPLGTSERELGNRPPSLQVMQLCDVQFHLAIAGLDAHRIVYHAIAERDPVRAREAMHDHLADVL